MASECSSEEAADLPAVCEVCGSDAAASVMLLCRYYGPDHQVGCHTFCQPGPGVKRSRSQDEKFQCLACTDFCRSFGRALEEAREATKAAALHKKGRIAEPEELPALKPLQASHPRVRHGHEAVPHPTEQQRINAAAAAAAAGRGLSDGSDGDARQPRTKQRRIDRPAAAAAGGGRSGGKAGRYAAAEGAHGSGRQARAGPAGAAAAAGDVERHVRKRATATDKFVKGLNAGNPASVRAAQGKTQAAKAAALKAGRTLGNRPAAAAAGRAPAAAAAPAGDAAAEDQHEHWEEPLAHLEEEEPWTGREQVCGSNQGQQRPGRRHRGLGLVVSPADYNAQLMASKLDCQLVVNPQQQQEHGNQGQQPDPQDADPSNYCSIMGTFWRSTSLEEEAEPEQQQEHRQLLKDMENEQAGQPHLQLLGGVFDMAAHPTVERFVNDPNITYRPLLFIPNDHSGKDMVLELLDQRHRFAVMSVGSKLLVLLPTHVGTLVGIRTRTKALCEELTDEVVKTILAHPRLGCPSQDRSGSAVVQSPSESLQGPPVGDAAQEDNKDGILPPHAQQPPASPQQQEQQQQQQQQQEEGQGQVEEDNEDEGDQAGPELPQQQEEEEPEQPAADAQQQQQPLPQQQEPTAAAQTSTCIGGLKEQQQQQQQQTRVPVRELPLGMRVGASQQQQQQQQQDSLHAAPAAPARLAANRLESLAAALGPAVVAAAAAAAAAAAGASSLGLAAGRLGAHSISPKEAVEGSALAVLLQRFVLDAAGASSQHQQQPGQQQALTLRSFVPQVVDLADVSSLRLFLVGFPPEWLADGAVLSRPIKAAKQLVDGVYSSPMALQDLVQDLGLQPVPSRPSSPSILPSGTPQHPMAPGSPLPDGRAAAPRQGSMELDLTGGPADSVFRVLLVPDHFDSQQLQQLLGQVPLWQLLASPVAVFRQGPDQGLLHQLQQLSRQQRRLQKQQHGAAAGSSGVLQLLPCAAWRQVYRNGLAVVVDSTTLQHTSTEDIQQLLQLLQQAQEQQRALQAEAKGVVEVGGWQLMLLQQHLEALSADKQELLRRCAAHNTVVLLHHKLAPGSLAADAAERTNYFVQAAVTLATQQQQDLRHVAVIVPDVGDRLLGTGQPQSPALSGADPTAAAAAPRGAASVPGRSGSRGSLQAAAMAQAGAQDASILREIACMKLDLASQQPRLLSGTFGQLLQLLTALLGSSSDQRAGTEATGTS